jgi:hypothetical protein
VLIFDPFGDDVCTEPRGEGAPRDSPLGVGVLALTLRPTSSYRKIVTETHHMIEPLVAHVVVIDLRHERLLR